MDKRIIYPNDNGGVSVIIPTGEIPIKAVAAKDVPAGKPYRIVDVSAIPFDRTFRDAWEYGNGITINFLKAQEITKSRLRREREPLLQAQDIAFQRALETGADTTAIIAEKHRLRDVTKQVDACQTLDELKALHASAGFMKT